MQIDTAGGRPSSRRRSGARCNGSSRTSTATTRTAYRTPKSAPASRCSVTRPPSPRPTASSNSSTSTASGATRVPDTRETCGALFSRLVFLLRRVRYAFRRRRSERRRRDRLRRVLHRSAEPAMPPLQSAAAESARPEFVGLACGARAGENGPFLSSEDVCLGRTDVGRSDDISSAVRARCALEEEKTRSIVPIGGFGIPLNFDSVS